MKIRFILSLLLFSFSVLNLSAAGTRPVLLLGHGSDTWKVGKVLSTGNIASKTIRDWPPVGSWQNYSAVYIGESVQGIALNAWSDKDFREVEKYVADGGVLIFSGDTAFQLTGKNPELAGKFANFFGFKAFRQIPQDGAAFAEVADPRLAAASGSGEKHSHWVRNATLAADGLTSAKVLMTFTVKGQKYAAAVENPFGKGKVYYLAPTMHRVAGNGEIELGQYSKNGKWELNARGRSAEKFSRFVFALLDRVSGVSRIPARCPAAVTGGDASRVQLALRRSDVEFTTVKGLFPADYGKYALVYIGETLKTEKTRPLWTEPGQLAKVRSYLENGGVIVTSGEVPPFLTGGKRDMGVLAPLFGFSSFKSVRNADLGDFVFTAKGEGLRKNADLGSAVQNWKNRVNCFPDKLNSAVVLGEFRTPNGNIPAFTVNRVGKGALYWIATNPFRLVPDRNEILGDPDDNGIFVLNARGRAASELQKLFVVLFKTPANIALRKDFPEKAQWGLVPLGSPGNLPSPGKFRNPVVCRPPQPLKNAFLLSRGGAAQAVIAAPSKALERPAAELRKYLEAITGAKFQIVRSVPKGGNAIVLFDEGTAGLAGFDLKKAGEDTVIIETRGGKLWVGGKGMGPSLAVHYLLEKLGCRKLWPGKSGTIIPHRPTLYAPELTLRSTPKLSTRALRYAGKYYPRAAQNAAKCGVDLQAYLDATSAGTHDFFQWHGIISNREKDRKWTTGLSHSSRGNFYQRFGKTHPEYFALQSSGSRSQDSSPVRYRLCHSNRNMIRQLAADCLKAIEADPGTRVVSIPLTDGGGTTFCMCRKCRELDPVNAAPEMIPFLMGLTPQKVKYVALTDRVLTFSNAVAEIVTKKYPDVKVYMYVYSHYASAPVKVKPHPSLLVLVANVNYTKESVRQHHLRDMMKFATFPGTYFWRTNALWGFNSTLAPQDFARKMFADLELFKANVITGTDIDCFEHHWSCKTLVYYALSKAFWNPDRLGFDAVADDFCRQGFGPAASEMRDFFSVVEKTTNAAAEAEGHYLDFFDEKVIGALRSLLAKARTKAKNDPAVLERIDFIAVGVNCGELSRKMFVARKKNDSAGYETLRRKYLAYIRETVARQPFALNPARIGQYDDFVK